MILSRSRAPRVFAYPESVDRRNGYDGLFGLVKQGLGRDPLSDDPRVDMHAKSRALGDVRVIGESIAARRT